MLCKLSPDHCAGDNMGATSSKLTCSILSCTGQSSSRPTNHVRSGSTQPMRANDTSGVRICMTASWWTCQPACALGCLMVDLPTCMCSWLPDGGPANLHMPLLAMPLLAMLGPSGLRGGTEAEASPSPPRPKTEPLAQKARCAAQNTQRALG